MSEKIEVVVTNEFIGERLDVALSKILPKSRSNIQRALKEMGIKPSMKVKDTMKFELTFTEEERAEMRSSPGRYRLRCFMRTMT